jgi:ferredoxin-thioredoxin reductase catalytic subunit
MGMADIRDEAVESLYRKLVSDAEQGGYRLNPDAPFTKALVRGLLVNKERYGYVSCPCRLAAGKKEDDLDIICPCDYRDPDLSEFGACYCALYVSEDIFKGLKKVRPVPERRVPRTTGATDGGDRVIAPVSAATAATGFSLRYPVWRCKVCGYLCARDEPPGLCPVCKAGKERFERFI